MPGKKKADKKKHKVGSPVIHVASAAQSPPVSPQEHAPSPLPQSPSPDPVSAPSPQEKAAAPHEASPSPQAASPSPIEAGDSSPQKAASPAAAESPAAGQAASPAPASKSPAKKAGEQKAARPASALEASASPSKGKSPVAAEAGSPQKKAKSPVPAAEAGASKGKSPVAEAGSSPSKGKSPVAETGSPQKKAKSPVVVVTGANEEKGKEKPVAMSVGEEEGGSEDEEMKVVTHTSTAPELRGYVAGPLSSEEQAAKRQLKAAYASFWANLKFRKGWDTPLFLQSEVDDLLDQAADVVARIRVHQDALHPGFKLRMLEGNAHEYLWTQQTHPRTRADDFVRELVHHTLRDANGYVEGLSENVIDLYIEHIRSYWRMEDENLVLRHEVQLLRAKVHRQWREVLPLCNDAFTPLTPAAKTEAQYTIVQLATYRELARALSRVQYHARVLLEERTKRREARARVQQASADAQERFQEQVVKREQLKAALKSSNQSPAPEPAAQVPAEDPPADDPPADDPPADDPPAEAQRSPLQRVPSKAAEVEVKHIAEEDKDEEEDDPEDPPALKKIEELVAQVNVRKSELDRMKGRASELEIKELVGDPLQSQKTVKSLHERCKYLSLELERDLLKLDAIVGGAKVRPMRKAQVQNIQHMLEDVDSINTKLSGLETALLPAVEEEHERLVQQKRKEEEELAKQKQAEEERKREEAKRLAAEEEQKAREQAALLEKQRGSLVERWKQLKLQPKFEVEELRNGYQVSAYIPGMRKEDLEISTQGNTITLSGTRLPSAEEEASMGQVLRARGLAVDDQNLLRLGAGRFGRFQQQYSLPSDVDTSGIKATYEAGVFQVIMPRKVVPRAAAPRGYGRPGGGGGFFNDRDFWW